MTTKLYSRKELTALLGFQRTAFHMLKVRFEGFPGARGARAHVPLYDLHEVAVFLFENSPEFLMQTPEGMKLAGQIMKDKGII